jgi:hypothetical protein
VCPFVRSVQVAPFWQGLEAHSLTSVWQRMPAKPEAQLHVNPLSASLHVAPLRQGSDAHSLIWTLQFVRGSQPGSHSHCRYCELEPVVRYLVVQVPLPVQFPHPLRVEREQSHPSLPTALHCAVSQVRFAEHVARPEHDRPPSPRGQPL